MLALLASVQSYTREVGSTVAGRARSYREVLDENRFAYLLFMPTLVFIVGLIWFPFIRGIWMSFHEWPLLGEARWLGLGNYTYLFGWDPFITSLKATLIYALTTFVQLGVAILAALLLKHQKRFKNLINGTFLLPYTMPPVVTGAIWLYLLNPNVGPVFTALTEFGILDQAIYWATEGVPAMAVVMGVLAWTFWPFMFLIILASLENIPEEHYETARVYGAGRLQQFLKVTLPQLKSAILVAVSIRMVWNLTKISQPLQLTGGGPGYDTSILAVLVYRFGWLQGSMGLAFAVGVILLIVTLGFILLFIREFERETGVEG